MSRTPSEGLPTIDCHDGFAYPRAASAHDFTLIVGVPDAHPLGPPLPEAVVCIP